MSFDVISLFTKVPTALALEVVQQRLTSDGTLQERTSLTVDDIMSLLSLCLDGTYFTFRNVTYQQIYGTAMGSPVSVVVANLVMEHVEKLAISSFVRKPCFWKQYVDDVCCSVQEYDVNDLLVHLNSIEPSIQFTCEVEKNRHLPYRDILLEHNLDGTISTRVYRKPTHTERYLDFSSHHPPAQPTRLQL